MKLKILFLTDHSTHHHTNSLYGLATAMALQDNAMFVDVASRGIKENSSFFFDQTTTEVRLIRVGQDFTFNNRPFESSSRMKMSDISEYDVIMLRLPHPVSDNFLTFLAYSFEGLCINDPLAIMEVSSKAYLENFSQFCPPIKVCEDMENINSMSSKFPIVLKPFRNYGGKGILKIDGRTYWLGSEEISYDQLMEFIEEGFENDGWLAMKYLKNVHKGDKRIVVVNGKIVGASLRRPAEDSWLCNVAQGGSSSHAEPDLDEINIVNHVSPVLLEEGIVMYGLDTLVNDDGKRVISEINVLSVGGLIALRSKSEDSIFNTVAKLLWKYIKKTRLKSIG